MPEPTEHVLPHAVALSWGVAEQPMRGPKREMSVERIVDVAIEIADADGLAAVSMSKVATSLGYTTMSLYRYVTSKDDLLLLMQDAVADIAVPPQPVEANWRDELREWVLLNLEVYRAHPWFGDIPVSGIPLTPNNLRVVDAGLRALSSATLTDHEKMAVVLLASGYAKTAGALERDLARAVASGIDPDAVQGRPYTSILRELVTEERFPYLRPVILSGAYTDEDTDYDDIAFGLERLLDGVQHYLDTRETTSAAHAHTAEYEAAAELSKLYSKDPAVRQIAQKRREAEVRVRELAKRERDAIAKARDRAAKQAADDARKHG